MESAICLRHCPFPYGSKGFQGARPSRFHHLKINHATPLSLPQIFTTRSSVTRSFGHVNCMLERFISMPSENEGSGNRILRGVAAASLVLTCVLGLFSFSGKNMNPKLTTAYGNGLEFPISKPQGRFALKSLLEIPKDEELADTQNKMRSNFSVRGPSQQEVKNLKWLAIGLSSQSPDRRREAQKTLEEQYNCESGEPEQNLELAMVELLMFQGEFDKARDRLDDIIRKISKVQPSGMSKLYKTAVQENNMYEKLRLARLILYKAIVHTVLGSEQKEREQWWNAFMETCRK
ncbi:uncharacterized protein LOC114412673 [Glycine soja]|uniref:Uncharacterized protein n=1 Tax=Glycine soja TaxID=3848 RepID=A0A445KN82_GLYSO|nr:uncharacterized protein LOC114412673 [Glycine soja]KHN25900.1 hypothetical protein glysoja_018754 [Glycine soja]RZC12234.1 hypothetical protein D0Y65_012162 [Glycine soja]